MQGLRWCFTLNNYVEAELESTRKSLSDSTKVRQAIFGKEKGKSGTPHLQGYISLKKKCRLTGVKKVVGN